MVSLLVISTLFPNAVQQRHGIFVETRLQHLLERGTTRAVVIAPVPWYPFSDTRSGKYVQSSRIAHLEERHGVQVWHPRYLAVPGLGLYLNPWFLWLSVFWQTLRLLLRGQRFDVVDGHYYYPDGIAAALTARLLRLPYTITARGTDINLIPDYKIPRWLILWAAKGAARSITVCRALKEQMVELGAMEGRIEVLRNGVDLNLFSPLDRPLCRNKFGIDCKALVSIGHLIERKGHHLVIEAMKELPDYQLLIAGDGEMETELRAQALQAGVSDRVSFLGALSQPELAELYSAADALVLASSREGWANVLLESMACGCPVVATSIWGTPEVVAEPAAGVLVAERSPAAIAQGVRDLFAHYPSRESTRQYAERFSWQETVDRLESLFDEIGTGRAA
ncbi:glycosyltransferase [Pseudomaricurvus sp. HS19]|nr:glycosyltransferase [Pseudomaricurvus sp. HS19]